MKVQELFQAYYDARRNKRSSANALAFEANFESNIFALYDEIVSGRYRIGPSVCFITFKPVQREIFAADFRDRVVHHFIYNHISTYFERTFINDSYSCRVGRGTSYGIKRLDHFIRSCSSNYHRDCYVLKLDIKGYFMSIYRPLLYRQTEEVIRRNQHALRIDVDLLLSLIHKTIFYDPTKNCRVQCPREDWVGLPKSKSLFFAKSDCGLPIGNLTSQLFGNVYLNDFDHFAKRNLKCDYYGRYVDDFVFVHRSKEYLKSLIPEIEAYLRDTCFLELHRGKIYLQHFTKGVSFLGTVIKPYRMYIGNRTKGNCHAAVRHWKGVLERKGGLDRKDVANMVACINSYLGAMKQCDTYRLRESIVASVLASDLAQFVRAERTYEKVIPKV